MTRFPSVEASVGEPFFDAAPLPLTRLERLAEDSGLPGTVVSQARGVISLAAAEHFMARLDRRVLEPTYFLDCARQPATTRPNTVANIELPHVVTGIEAVDAVATYISSILYGAEFLTERAPGRIWLLRTASTTPWTNRWPVQQYNLEVGRQALSEVLGRPLTPVALRLSAIVERWRLPEDWHDLPVELSDATMGLAFSIDDLLGPKPGLRAMSVGATKNDALPAADREVLQACIEGYLSTASPNTLSHMVARGFGFSERAYRRHLNSLGLTHRQLVSDARLTRAERMLTDMSLTVTEIAFELGYAHPSAFTRFFTERVGITPAEYRKRGAVQSRPV